MENTKDYIDSLISDREKFNSFVYTSPNIAVQVLRERRLDHRLKQEMHDLLSDDLPPPFIEGARAVFFSQLTPNFEIRRFISLIDGIDAIDPVFLEYCDDKFVTENQRKYTLGKIHFFNGRGKQGGMKIDSKNIIDFNTSNGKKISEIETIWGQKLLDFHHEFFDKTFIPLTNKTHFDISQWLRNHGPTPTDYYQSILKLMVRDGILFENFMLDETEISFTKEVFLPAFISVFKKTGKKPLVVALEPTEIEGDLFWLCHPNSSEQYLLDKIVNN